MPGSPTASTEIFNEALGTFSAGPSMNQAVYDQSATALSNGTVLINGGYGDVTYCCQVVGYSEIFTPASP
jgi:hypothetical protein